MKTEDTLLIIVLSVAITFFASLLFLEKIGG
jgi:hypothetical protein